MSRLHKRGLLVLLLSSSSMLGACLASTGYTASEKELIETLGPSAHQPRTQLERESVETQDLFAQAAFWSREYDLNPADLEAAIKLSSSLRKLGNANQALEITRGARAMFPRDTDLLAEYGASLIALERGKDAIAPLSGAVRQAPRNPRLWSLLGAAYDQIGQYTKGREHYSKALSISPNDSNVLANVGLSYALEGDPARAEIWLRRAVQNPNASASVRQNLALVLGLQGKYVEAESLAREDLNAEGAENNLAYLKSLRGSGRTYEALETPTAPVQSQPQAAPRPAPQQAVRNPYAPRVYGQTNPNVQPQDYARTPQAAPQQRAAQPLRQTSRMAPAPSGYSQNPYGQQRLRTQPYQQQQPTLRSSQQSAPQTRAPQVAPTPTPSAWNSYYGAQKTPSQVHSQQQQSAQSAPALSRTYAGSGALPETAPNVTPQSGGAREAAMAAAKRLQARGAVRTEAVTPSQQAAQGNVLSRIAQSLGRSEGSGPYASRVQPAPYVGQQQQVQQQQVQQQAQYGSQQAPQVMQMQTYPPVAAPQSAQYRAPARRRE